MYQITSPTNNTSARILAFSEGLESPDDHVDVGIVIRGPSVRRPGQAINSLAKLSFALVEAMVTLSTWEAKYNYIPTMLRDRLHLAVPSWLADFPTKHALPMWAICSRSPIARDVRYVTLLIESMYPLTNRNEEKV